MARCSPSGAHSSHGASRTAARGKKSGSGERRRGRPGTKSGPKEGGGRATARRLLSLGTQPKEPGPGARERTNAHTRHRQAPRAGVAEGSSGHPEGAPGNEGPPPGPRPATPERANDITPGGRAPWRSAAPGPCGQEEADGPRAPAGDAAQEVPRPDHPATQCRRPQEGLSRDAKQPTQQQPLPGGVRQR